MTLKLNGELRADPVFRGLHAVLGAICDLIDRPRWWPRDSEIRGDRPLPLLCLIRNSTEPDFLGSLSSRLGQASPDKVPHALINAEHAEEHSQQRWAAASREAPLLPLLDELHHQLVADRFGSGRLTRFRHYRLADWLTGQRIAPVEGRDDRANVTDKLRDWYIGSFVNSVSPADTISADIPASGWMKFLLAIFVVWHRPLRFRLWVRGLPLVGREPRWFLKQPFMVPQHSLTFYGFAERLTVGRHDKENPDQIKKVLVHAFLQDLRIVYQPRRLRLRRWRRTAYPVALLDNITKENGGWELLRLINEVRNERGDLDPLLVVAGSEQLPPWLQGQEVTPELPPAHKIKTELDEWYRQLPVRRQQMQDDARFVTVRLPSPVSAFDQHSPGGTSPSDADEAAWPKTTTIQPRKPPWLARKRVLPTVMVVVMTVPVMTGSTWMFDRWVNDCLPDPSTGVAAEWREDLQQCIGYSDDNDLVFGTDERLRQVQRAVFEQNSIAETLHEDNSGRPMVSVIYFAALTHPEADPGTDHSIAEELEGLLMRQHQQNRKEQSAPVLRVIVANGGSEMQAAPEVVRDLLVPLLREDQTVLGVIGMDRTVSETEEAITILGDLGVPVVATTLTGEGLPARSPLYFQLVPGNRVEADLVVEYARRTARRVTVYHPPLTDNYMKTLVEEVQAKIGHARSPRGWSRSAGEVEVQCGQDEVAFYAGREDQFADFLRRVVEECNENLPTVIGDDAVIRFMAQQDERSRPELNQLSVSWVDMGSLVVLAGESCRTKGDPETSKRWAPLLAFCAGYRWLHEQNDQKPPAANDYAKILKESMQPPWAGQGVGLSYDAAGLFIRAVSENQRRPDRIGGEYAPNRAAIAQEFREGKTFEGATGVINFNSSRDGSQRNLAILTIVNIGNGRAAPICEHIIGDTYPSDDGADDKCPT